MLNHTQLLFPCWGTSPAQDGRRAVPQCYEPAVFRQVHQHYQQGASTRSGSLHQPVSLNLRSLVVVEEPTLLSTTTNRFMKKLRSKPADSTSDREEVQVRPRLRPRLPLGLSLVAPASPRTPSHFMHRSPSRTFCRAWRPHLQGTRCGLDAPRRS